MPDPVQALPRRLLDAAEVATLLRMSKRQVFRAADQGSIPVGCHVGRLRRWDASELDMFIANGCRPARGKGGR